MVSARSAAMGFNRLVDARIRRAQSAHGDARDAARRDERDAKRRSSSSSSSVVFVFGASRLSPLCLAAVAGRAGDRVLVFAGQALHHLHAGVSRPGDGGGAGRRLACGRRPRRAASRGCSAWRSGCGSAASTSSTPARTSSSIAAHGLNSIPVRFGVAGVAAALARDARRHRRLHGGALARSPACRPLYLGGVALRRRAAGLRAVAGQRRRSVAGEARVRSERLGRHPLLRDDGAGVVCRLKPPRSAMLRQPPDKTPARIAGMFDAIAPRYDLLNTSAQRRPRSALAARARSRRCS